MTFLLQNKLSVQNQRINGQLIGSPLQYFQFATRFQFTSV